MRNMKMHRQAAVAAAGVVVGLAWCGSHGAMAAGTNVVDLGDMVVVNRVEQRPQDVAGAVGVVTTNDLSQLVGANALEALRQLPGVVVQGSAVPGTPMKPILRGQSPGLISKRVLVLVDGRRVAEPFQGGVDFALMTADHIERIEVLRGPASALYGSDAMAGVINIVTRRGTATPQADVRAAYGTDDFQQYRARHGGQQGPVDYYLTAGHLQTDGDQRNADGTRRNWKEDNLTGNVGLDLGEHADARFYTGYYGAEGSDDTSDREIDKDYQHGEWTCTWDPAHEATVLVRAYRNGDDQVYRWKFPGEGHYDMETLGAEVQQSLWAGRRNRVTVGADVREDSVDSRDVSGPIDEEGRVAGAYLQDEYLLLERLTLVGGVRADDDEDYGSEVTPRGSALWRVGPDAELFAGVARAYRAPSLSDRYFRGFYDDRFFEGNPDLDPETMTAYELGGRARPTERVQLELTGFYNDLKDSFEFAEDTDGVFRNRNIARSQTYGIESGVRAAVTERAEVYVTYTYTEGEYDEFPTDPSVEGNRLQYLAPHVAAAGVSYDAAALGRHALSGRYVADRYADDRNTPSDELDAYTVFDWSSRVPLGRHAAVTLNVQNLFDESYAEYFGVEQPGLSVIGGLEVAL
jgi:outer membrane cobalamin receptor